MVCQEHPGLLRVDDDLDYETVKRRWTMGRERRTVTTWEEGFSAKHLREDAANAPHIDRTCVFFECEHNLRSTVPPLQGKIVALVTGSRATITPTWWPRIPS